MEKKFDAVAWMRKRREEIDKEDNGLSWEEKHEKSQKLLEKDPLWQSLRNCLVEPASIPAAKTRFLHR